jgi:hypothetical protein
MRHRFGGDRMLPTPHHEQCATADSPDPGADAHDLAQGPAQRRRDRGPSTPATWTYWLTWNLTTPNTL